MLVIPGVVQAGFGIGGQYGQGAPRVGGQSVGCYRLAAGSAGFQPGVQKKDVILVFLRKQALDESRAKQGWQVGVDGSVVLVNVGAHGSFDTAALNQPIVGVVVGQPGLMYNLTLQGTKITRRQE